MFWENKIDLSFWFTFFNSLFTEWFFDFFFNKCCFFKGFDIFDEIVSPTFKIIYFPQLSAYKTPNFFFRKHTQLLGGGGIPKMGKQILKKYPSCVYLSLGCLISVILLSPRTGSSISRRRFWKMLLNFFSIQGVPKNALLDVVALTMVQSMISVEHSIIWYQLKELEVCNVLLNHDDSSALLYPFTMYYTAQCIHFNLDI